MHTAPTLNASKTDAPAGPRLEALELADVALLRLERHHPDYSGPLSLVVKGACPLHGSAPLAPQVHALCEQPMRELLARLRTSEEARAVERLDRQLRDARQQQAQAQAEGDGAKAEIAAALLAGKDSSALERQRSEALARAGRLEERVATLAGLLARERERYDLAARQAVESLRRALLAQLDRQGAEHWHRLAEVLSRETAPVLTTNFARAALRELDVDGYVRQLDQAD